MEPQLMDEQEPQLEKNPTFLQELGEFLRENRKWWLTPIVIVIALLGILIALGGTSAAPFVYTLF
jgi:hypothetical protein